jgi:hypothetical protein
MGSDFYELTILRCIDRDLRHGAPATTIRRVGSLSRDCARQPAARYRNKYDYVLHVYCLMPNHANEEKGTFSISISFLGRPLGLGTQFGTLLTSWTNSVTGCSLSHLTLPLLLKARDLR